jgi:hypothetical protein
MIILLFRGSQLISFAKFLQRGFHLKHSTVPLCSCCKQDIYGSLHVKIGLTTLYWRIMPLNMHMHFIQTNHTNGSLHDVLYSEPYTFGLPKGVLDLYRHV